MRLYLAEAEYRAAQRHHDGSAMASARYRAAATELQAAQSDAADFLILLSTESPSEGEKVVEGKPASTHQAA